MAYLTTGPKDGKRSLLPTSRPLSNFVYGWLISRGRGIQWAKLDRQKFDFPFFDNQ